MLDLRVPSGFFFLLLGFILTALGIFMPSLRASLTTANVNLYVGLTMIAFGGVLLWLARRYPSS